MIKTHENIRQRVWGVEDRKVIAQNTLVSVVSSATGNGLENDFRKQTKGLNTH